MTTFAEIIKNRKRPVPRGPGTELKKLLASFNITEESGCGCGSMVARMDRLGSEGCRVIMPEIVAHLEAQARQRGWKLPYMRGGAEVLVRWAFLRSRTPAQA